LVDFLHILPYIEIVIPQAVSCCGASRSNEIHNIGEKA